MGLLFKSDTAFTDTTLPIFRVDPILPQGNGALFLIDPSNTATDTSFKDVATGTIENLAWDLALATIGSGAQATLRGVTSKLFNAGEGLVEITAKKGIHTIVSQTTNVDNHGFKISLPDLIKQFIVANWGHSYFLSVWGDTTRVTAETSTFNVSTAGIGQANVANGYLAYSTRNYYAPTSAPARLGTRFSVNDSTRGSYIRNIGATPGGSAPTAANLLTWFGYGSISPFHASEVNKAPSGVIYKIYIEDLTISGRNYADVDAIDNALFTAAFAAGGRFNGDSYTAASTIA